MPLDRALERSHTWMVACAGLLDGSSFETTNRARVAVSLLHLCVEHQTGIHTLVDHGVLGSAFALLRPQFESYVRGVWYHRCATDARVAEFVSGKEPPKIGPLITAIEGIPGLSDGVLTRIKQGMWKELNDFTHGGTIQVKSRVSADFVGLNWKQEHIAGLLDAAVIFSKLAGVEIAALTGNESLALNLQRKYKELYEAAA